MATEAAKAWSGHYWVADCKGAFGIKLSTSNHIITSIREHTSLPLSSTPYPKIQRVRLERRPDNGSVRKYSNGKKDENFVPCPGKREIARAGLEWG